MKYDIEDIQKRKELHARIRKYCITIYVLYR